MELGDRALGLLLLLFSSTLFAYYTFWVIITVSVTSTSLSLSALLCISVTAPFSFSVSFSFSLPQISVRSSLFVSGFFVLDLYVVMFCSFVGLSFDVCVCMCAAICGHRSLCSQLLSCTRICNHHSWPCWSCTHLLCACLCGSCDGEVTTCKTQGQDQLTNSPPLCHPKRETDDHRSHYCCVYITIV